MAYQIRSSVTAASFSPTLVADYGAAGILSDVVAESTAAAGVTIDGVLVKDAKIACTYISGDETVVATAACANATGGATTALMSVTLKQRDNSTAITTARQCILLIQPTSARYSDLIGPPGTASLGTVTAGAIIATLAGGAGYLIQTNASGLFACTVTNSADETLYFGAKSASVVSAIGERCVVLGSNSDDGVWSA